MGTVVFVSGIFDALHVGHIRLLHAARDLGDELVVGIVSRSLIPNMQVASDSDRLEALRSLRDISSVVLITDSVSDLIEEMRPDVVVKGQEHRLMDNPEAEVVARYGGRLVFTSGSVSDSVRLETGDVNAPTTATIRAAIQESAFERGLSPSRLVDIVHQMGQLRVLVAGDVIVDEYVRCTPVGMSREDATLVVKPFKSELFVGGAAIVAAHARSLGEYTSLHSVAGRDRSAAFLLNELAAIDVAAHLVQDPLKKTTTKQRWMTESKVHLRVNAFDSLPISDEISANLEAVALQSLAESDVLILSDFSYGALPDPFVNGLITEAHAKGVLIAADSQTSSQIGNIGRFVGAHLLTPTEHEARVALRNTSDGLVVLADQLREATSCSTVCLTLAGEGILIRGSEPGGKRDQTLRIPAFNDRPEDVSGAGDSLLASMSMAMRSGATLTEAGLIGSAAAAIQVSRAGNQPVNTRALIEVLSP